jgi:hypothetical protein
MDDEDKVERIDDTKRSLNDGLTLCRKIVDHYRSTLAHYAKDEHRPNSIFGRRPDEDGAADDERRPDGQSEPWDRRGAGLQ